MGAYYRRALTFAGVYFWVSKMLAESKINRSHYLTIETINKYKTLVDYKMLNFTLRQNQKIFLTMALIVIWTVFSI